MKIYTYFYLDDEKALLPIHQKELEKYTSADKGFTEETYGANLFSGLREPVKVGKVTCVNK
jgi:hypothetical protein